MTVFGREDANKAGSGLPPKVIQTFYPNVVICYANRWYLDSHVHYNTRNWTSLEYRETL